jgi:hypothetical protein
MYVFFVGGKPSISRVLASLDENHDKPHKGYKVRGTKTSLSLVPAVELLNIIAAQPPWCQQACDRKDQLCPRWLGGYNRPKRSCRWSKVQAAFRASFPKSHRDFLEALKVQGPLAITSSAMPA